MKAFVITGPGEAAVQDVEPPTAAPGDVVVAVQRAGICGTDVELYTGEMQYIEDGFTTFPIRIGSCPIPLTTRWALSSSRAATHSARRRRPSCRTAIGHWSSALERLGCSSPCSRRPPARRCT